ncbi:hypothetical protein B7463_g9559, partial [Scytalidium lignicola]
MLESPRSTHLQAPARQVVGSITSAKLRDSCHACALSKVKCHKERPTCSRCARRGTTCEYFVTKRPGRKGLRHKDSNAGNNDKVNVVQPALPGGCDAHDSTTSTCAPLSTIRSSSSNCLDLTPPDHNSNSIEHSNSSPSVSISLDIFSSLLMPLESYPSSVPVGMSYDLERFLTPPANILDLDAFDPNNFTHGRSELDSLLTSPTSILDLDVFDPNNFTQGRNDLDGFLTSPTNILDWNDFDSNNFSQGCSDIAIPININSELVSGTSDIDIASPSLSGSSDTSNSTCRCLVQALDLVLANSQPSTSPYYASTTSNSDVIVENKHTIESVTNMLKCSCSEDGYVLSMLSMIVVKMLGQYASAIRKQASNTIVRGDNLHVSTKEHILRPPEDGQALDRMAAQAILGELHCVQQLVDQLSMKLKTHRGNLASKGVEIPTDGETPSSTTTLNQIEIDMQKSLNTLSSSIINMLRYSQ